MDKVTVTREERIKDLAKVGSIYDFAGNCEAETMVLQTLRACVLNLSDPTRREAYSFKGVNTRASSGGGLVNNSRGLQILIHRGWIVEESRAGVNPPLQVCLDQEGAPIVLLPTDKLLDDLGAHLRLV